MGRRKYYVGVIIVLLVAGLATNWWDANGEKLQAYYAPEDIIGQQPSFLSTQLKASVQHQSRPAPQSPKTPTQNLQLLNRLVHIGQFGLGHRMSKLSASYHLAIQLRNDAQVPLVVQADWGVCEKSDSNNDPGGGPIWEYLFGDPTLLLPGDTSPQPVERPVEIRIVNDCPGYYGAQVFKNQRVLVFPNYTQDTSDSPFFNKMNADAKLFELLQSRFNTIHPEAKAFCEKHRFADHTVLGLHIRAGNGEQNDFIWRGRGMGGNEFLTNLANSFQKLLDHLQQQQSTSKPFLLFLATDTPTMIEEIRQIAANSWKIPVVTFEQPTIPLSGGVSFQAWKTGQRCLEGWKAMMVDAILLASVDVLVAAMRSSFAQTMPLALLFHRHAASTSLRFCEVSDSGKSMTCLKNRRDWLFRTRSNEWTFGSDSSVVHLTGVHFPDVDRDAKTQRQYKVAVNFLKGQGTGKDPTAKFLPWGSGFNKKYRQKKKGQYTIEWTFE